MPPRRKLAAVPPPRVSPNLRDSVDAAINAMGWLQPTDQALADLARKLAEQIEEAQERADLLKQAFAEFAGDPGMYKRLQRLEAMCDLAKVLQASSQPLLLALRDLGGTPTARKALAATQPVGGALAALRNATAGARVHGAEGVDPPAG